MSESGWDFDVIVVGFGMAGACAAISAAESGAKVLVIDRGLGGGASALSGGIVYAGGGTPYQQQAGFEDSPDNMFDYLHQEVEGVVDDETLRRFCDGSVDQLAWLEKHGARFASSLCDYKTSYPTDRHYLYYSGNEKAYPYNRNAIPAPRGHRQIAPGMSSGRVLWEAMRDAALASGVTFAPMTRAERLEFTAAGEITGISCRTVGDAGSWHSRLSRRLTRASVKLINWVPPIGQLINRQADAVWRRAAETRSFTAPAVVLAAGGFIFNRDMVRRHAPAHVLVSPLGTAGDDGSGILLGLSAGGSAEFLDRVTAWRFISPPSAMIEGVAVGLSGARIANEDLYGATHARAMIRDYSGKGFLVLDSRMWDRAKSQFFSQTQLFQRAMMAPVFAGAHRKADTLAGLAAKLGVSQTGLSATVDAYNAAIRDGREDPLHKAAEVCTPIQQPPFYGIDISLKPSPLDFVPGLTLGGLTVDSASGQVRRVDGTSIPGLYAAGRNAVGVCSNSYVSGLSLADCVFSGRRAGEHAARTRAGTATGHG
ncbi:FAD-binding protein [Mycobacterium sp. CVI_P3]|uniref:FAD-binding protein n=1 Tax=Mycobacterium pinniadriaticum TaxID=2994102 RepID=A0ABT3SFP5_9MYCO|nr:FAD-binding protein [Mycobacterium pinniadriaticum]MCX2931278.1 FAD-binding protein [Mycobacterium pinniadriaticum]MCX2937702.1 FAD-binding protein [Mycobacterium pinniadriaticum]